MKSHSFRRTLLAGLVAVGLAVSGAVAVTGVTTAAPNGGGGPATDGTNQGKKPLRDTTVAIVQLAGQPLTVAANIDRGKGNRVNFNGTRTKAYRTQLRVTRDTFRDWLKVYAPKARVAKGFDISVHAVLVKLNGTTLATLRTSPLVLRAQYAGLYYPNDAVDPDLDLINAVTAWGGGGAEGAGAGVKVGIIDSGIDQDHQCFDDMGDSDGPGNFTNNKVIVAKVFNMRAGVMRYTPEAVESHGTHVAGTVACDFGTTAVVEGVTMPHTISGVAPAALLGNYNVFPDTVENARSEDILNALDAAYVDGMNIVNMSLGGGSNGIQDLLTVAVDNLDRGGMLSAISAGNDGPGFSTVGSPGMAARALTAGASTVPHIVSGSIDTSAGSALAAAAEFTDAVPGVYGPLDVVEGTGPTGVDALAAVSQACSPIPAAADGGIAVIARGSCDFVTKVDNVQAAGYDAVIVINREPGVFVMGGDPADTRTIPAVMIDLVDADVVLTAEGDVTLNGPDYYNPYGTANEMADFSSEGPTDVDRRVKPDLVSPGVNVLSSVPGGEFAFYNGTSMASPHLAGAAAVVWGQHPGWTAWQVRSAITNTADLGAVVVHYEGDLADDPNLVGAGLLDVAAAVDATALVSPVSASFGTAERGAGHTIVRYVTLKNLRGSTLTARVVDRHGSATFTVSGSVSANSTGVLTVVARTLKGAAVGHSWATVEILDGATVVAHMRVYVLVK